jgi:hypothetical protein
LVGSASRIFFQVHRRAAASPTRSSSSCAIAEQQAHALGGVGRAIGARVQQLRQIGPRLGLREDLLERGVGLLVEAELGDDRSAALRASGGGTAASSDAQRAPQQPQPLLGVGRRRRARLVERRQVAPLVGLAGQPLQIRRTVSFLGADSNARAHHWKASALDPRRCSQILRASATAPAFGQRVAAPARRPQQHLVRRQQPRPLLGVPVERQQRQRRAAVARVGRQDPLVRLERPLRLVQLLLRDQRDALEQARARRHVRGPIGQRRQLIAQIAERAVLGVQRFERV